LFILIVPVSSLLSCFHLLCLSYGNDGSGCRYSSSPCCIPAPPEEEYTIVAGYNSRKGGLIMKNNIGHSCVMGGFWIQEEWHPDQTHPNRTELVDGLMV
jgi:hypothetical protein